MNGKKEWYEEIHKGISAEGNKERNTSGREKEICIERKKEMKRHISKEGIRKKSNT